MEPPHNAMNANVRQSRYLSTPNSLLPMLTPSVVYPKKRVAKKKKVRREKGMVALTDQDRALLFWVACVPTSITIGFASFVLSALSHSYALRYAVCALSGLVAAGFVVAAMSRRPKGFLEGRVWWEKERYVHILNWSACAVLALLGQRWYGAPLLFDALCAIAFRARYVITRSESTAG